MDTVAELAQIAKRLSARQALDAKDRHRQRELLRQLSADGWTWTAMQEAAGISRTTLNDALHRDRD